MASITNLAVAFFTRFNLAICSLERLGHFEKCHNIHKSHFRECYDIFRNGLLQLSNVQVMNAAHEST